MNDTTPVPFGGELRPVEYEPAIDYCVDNIANMLDIISDDPTVQGRFLDELTGRLLNVMMDLLGDDYEEQL